MENKKAFRLLLFAHGVSAAAQGISILAIPWYFTDLIHKASLFGLIYAGTNIASLFWGVYVGTIVDKFNHKNIMLVLCSTGVIILGAVAGYGYTTNVLNAFLVGLIFVYTMLNHNVHYPTLYAFGQEMSLAKDYGRVNALIEITQQTAAMVSGALAAILLSGISVHSKLYQVFHIQISAWPIHKIFMVDGITYLIAVVLIAFIKYVPFAEKSTEKGSAWKRIKTGIAFLKDHPYIFLLGFCSYGVFLVIIVHESFLLPIYTAQHLKAQGDVYSLSYMIFAIGAILSGLLANRVFKSSNTVKTIIIFMIVAALSLVWCSISKSITILLIASLLLGLTNAGTRIMRSTYLFNNIPNYIIGRSSSVFNFINMFLRTFIILLFSLPFFERNDHVTWAYFICGIIVFACIVPLIVKYRKILEHPYLLEES